MLSSTSAVPGENTKNEDLELCSFVEQNLYTAVVSDSLDQLGARNQAMREYLRPLYGKCKFAGWARTISCSDIYHIPQDPYSMEIEAVDSLLPGEIAVVGTGQSKRNAPWANCCPLPRVRVAPGERSSTESFAMFKKSKSWAFPSSRRASSRWTPWDEAS